MTASTPAPILRTIVELAPRMATGEMSAETLLAECVARIAAHDRPGAGISAIVRLDPGAQAGARALDAERGRTGRTRAPLHGIPVVLKDNIDAAGLPTTSGSRSLTGAIPLADAGQTRRLRAAGAVLVAKTHLSEFSFELRSRSSLGGDVRNPFNLAVPAGGSSGGAAAAVAAGFAVAAIGTDTGGSIRIPASFNGLVGLRPTHGLIDASGVAPLSPSTDTVGPIARSAADAAVLFHVMTGGAAGHATGGHGRGLKAASVGVLRQAFGDDVEIGTVMDAAIRRMADAGCRIVDPVRLPQEVLPGPGLNVVDFEFRSAFDEYLASNFVRGAAPSSVAEIIAQGVVSPELHDALQRRVDAAGPGSPGHREVLESHGRLRRAATEMMDRRALDAVVYPTCATVPASLDNPRSGWAPELAARTGFPALTLPAGQAANLIPIGMELLGRACSEPLLLRLAVDIEALLALELVPRLG